AHLAGRRAAAAATNGCSTTGRTRRTARPVKGDRGPSKHRACGAGDTGPRRARHSGRKDSPRVKRGGTTDTTPFVVSLVKGRGQAGRWSRLASAASGLDLNGTD